ncbi:MAG TPA: DUF116 domain-containing protein [Candidatus Methanofastidiosa archaeon]|nr:DUF116 domain-containing protein [Candidatus Methanofastidiosa archaeon]
MLSLGTSFYELIGAIALILIVFTILLIVFGLIQLMISMRINKFIFPNLQSFLVDTFYSVFESAFGIFNVPSDVLEEWSITLKNHANREHFIKVPVSKRIVVLPQCLRSINCPANLSAKDGIRCLDCGRCMIKEFRKRAEELGYKVFVVPGGTFVKRIIKKERPEAVIGVGCFPDLVEGMKISKRAGIASQGVLLETSGCIETIIEWSKLYEKLYLGLDINKEVIA